MLHRKGIGSICGRRLRMMTGHHHPPSASASSSLLSASKSMIPLSIGSIRHIAHKLFIGCKCWSGHTQWTLHILSVIIPELYLIPLLVLHISYTTFTNKRCPQVPRSRNSRHSSKVMVLYCMVRYEADWWKRARERVDIPPPFIHLHTTARVVQSPAGEPRPPFGFIEFEDVKSAVAAMEEVEFRVNRVVGRSQRWKVHTYDA